MTQKQSAFQLVWFNDHSEEETIIKTLKNIKTGITHDNRRI